MTDNSIPGSRYIQKLNLKFHQEVIFTRNSFAIENQSLKELIPTGSNVLCFVDRGLLKANPELVSSLKKYLDYHNYVGLNQTVVEVPGGEEIKNDPEHSREIIKAIAESGMCRHSYLIAVGGGAVLDAVGFASSIVHRGIRHIRIPTTVLSQNDSSMGVKNGINYLGHKNFLGSFNPPEGVLVDFDFLDTLPDRYYRAGISEAYKVAILKDRVFLEWLIEHAPEASRRAQISMEQLVHRCAILHLNHIEAGGDPFEKESVRPLDFGHWSAHHLEEITHNDLNHGEAVSIGICLDLQIAAFLNLITEAEAERITLSIHQCGLPIWHDSLLQEEQNQLLLVAGLDAFRQHIGGKLTLVMPREIGQETEINNLPIETLSTALNNLKAVTSRILGS